MLNQDKASFRSHFSDVFKSGKATKGLIPACRLSHGPAQQTGGEGKSRPEKKEFLRSRFNYYVKRFELDHGINIIIIIHHDPKKFLGAVSMDVERFKLHHVIIKFII